MKQQTSLYESILGPLLLVADEQGLTEIRFLTDVPPQAQAAGQDRPLPALQAAARWLDQYFDGCTPDIPVPLHLSETPFQREVREIVQTIGRGQTMTYGEIASRIAAQRGIPRLAALAVGQALGRNPIPILIPCHRVTGARGNLTGYGGGLERKRLLLELENPGN